MARYSKKVKKGWILGETLYVWFKPKSLLGGLFTFLGGRTQFSFWGKKRGGFGSTSQRQGLPERGLFSGQQVRGRRILFGVYNASFCQKRGRLWCGENTREYAEATNYCLKPGGDTL